MKKALLIMSLVLLAVAAQAQIKMHSNGRLTFQTVANSTTQGVSIGPAPNWNVDINGPVFMKKCGYFMNPATPPFTWMSACVTSNATAKCWIVSYPGWNGNTFYVLGDGTVYSSQSRTISRLDTEDSRGVDTDPIDGDEAISILSSLNGYYVAPQNQETPDFENNENVSPEAVEAMVADLTKRTAELSAIELSHIFPDAVRTDPQNRLCIDYQSVVTMLVEAVKEQQRVIEAMRAVLEANGLMEPEKP